MSFYRDYFDKLAIKDWRERATAPYETFSLRQLSPTIGAEIGGLDLREDLSPGQLDEIRRALAENLVLVFRDQKISLEEHKRFARHFGRLHRHELAQTNIIAGRSAGPANCCPGRPARNRATRRATPGTATSPATRSRSRRLSFM